VIKKVEVLVVEMVVERGLVEELIQGKVEVLVQVEEL
jgi:hypothetical protein